MEGCGRGETLAFKDGEWTVTRHVCPRNCYDACGMLAYTRDGVLERLDHGGARPEPQHVLYAVGPLVVGQPNRPIIIRGIIELQPFFDRVGGNSTRRRAGAGARASTRAGASTCAAAGASTRAGVVVTRFP